MLAIKPSEPFKADWSGNVNRHNYDNQGLLATVARKIYNVVFYLPNAFLACCFNPRAATPYTPFHETGSIEEFNKKIVTPDGVPLTARVRLIDKSKQAKTVILFNPLGASSRHGLYSSLEAECLSKNCNVITFDYRGLGSMWRLADYIVDGESVYQYATKELGVEKDNVQLFGTSLGGAVATQVLALHPESKGKLVADRSFKSVFSLLKEFFSIQCLGALVQKISSFVFSLFIAYPVYLLGWELDGEKALKKIEGEKRIFYHPKDPIAPPNANLAALCLEEEVVDLGKNTRMEGFRVHFLPLDAHRCWGNNPINTVAEFLSA